MSTKDLWQRFVDGYRYAPEVGVSLDVSRMPLSGELWSELGPRLKDALAFMEQVESGAVANPDEGRMVGHYWLRNASLAPDPEISQSIDETFKSVRAFVSKVHGGFVRPPVAGVDRFTRFILIGIGGSALGPQLIADALASPDDAMIPTFVDNTDPDGIDRVLFDIAEDLPRTMVIVVSKSGGTKETRNGMLEVRRAFERLALDFPKHTVAVTGEGSKLATLAKQEGFLQVFPMWDWVGGRTSITSAVGFLPGLLQGLDMDAFLHGAGAMDDLTRSQDPEQNLAAMLATAWYSATEGKSRRAMVVLPYRDRLQYLSRYLQQLVMESLGKEFDLQGNVVHQGLTVYGNKGSTDQHAYVQQLREGPDDFFVNFLQVVKDRAGRSIEVDPGIATGDYLLGFLLGTRKALYDNNHHSLTITLDHLTADRLGALIALYERAVGIYAHLIQVNAYHQPGVEAGKIAAESVLALQVRLLEQLRASSGDSKPAADWAGEVDGSPETVFHVLLHLAANGRGVVMEGSALPDEAHFKAAP